MALNAAKLPKFEALGSESVSPRTTTVADLLPHSRVAWFCTCTYSCMVFKSGPNTVLVYNSIHRNCRAM